MEKAERVQPAGRAEWRDWLAANHATAPGVWLVTWKRKTGRPTVAYEEAVEEALCFGWIDGRVNGLDDERSMQWFAPRRPKGTWARTNKERVERLEAAGLMTDAGRAVIAVARANGAWDSLNDVDALVIPPELAAAFETRPGSKATFDANSVSSRRMTLAWISAVKRPDLRAERVARVLEVLGRGERLTRLFRSG
jgi:uncharacterized protein YdeI (YjbR/CyaY-like superfamily)